ncbi:MAG TPA: hypothetical protein VJP86_17740 [Vicinamibacterales bacterium]|nr:hypothetical protein [Vicinamibacterales bacterium]
MKARVGFVTILLAALAGPVKGQETRLPPSPPDANPPSTTFTQYLDASLLKDLPTSDSLFQVLETMAPSVIADRFSGGGLDFGRGSRLGSFFTSSSQTDYRVGDVSIRDPNGSGLPLLIPDLSLWRRLRITTGLMMLDRNAADLSIALDPFTPTANWVRTFYGSTSHGSLAGGESSADAPAINRLGGWNRVSAVATGPLVDGRVGAAIAATWADVGQVERGEDEQVSSDQGTLFANLVFTPANGSRFTTIGWLQRSTSPAALRNQFGVPDASTRDRAGHVQAAWERDVADDLALRLFAGFTQRRRSSDLSGNSAIFERLTDGPLDQVAGAGPSTVRTWTIGARMIRPDAKASTFEGGLELSGASNRLTSLPPVSAGELVNGLPARVWKFSQPSSDSDRSSTAATGYINGRMKFESGVTVEGGVAFDGQWGSAEGADASIGWQSLLPRAAFRRPFSPLKTTLFGGYRRSALRLSLDLLAVGDPFAPVADIYRWDASAGATPPSLALLGPLVARGGYGTAGDPTRSAIDGDLQQPHLDELVVGVSFSPLRDVEVKFTGFARRETDLFAFTNVGVSAADYSVIEVPDVGIDIITSADDVPVKIFNRLPPSFGKDRFLLTNQDDNGTSESVEVSVQLSKPNVLLYVGGSASLAEGTAAHRGYGPLENDETAIGELFTTPNAESFAKGRLFNDRAFTGKVIGVFRLPADTRLGVLARYQDGQPFGRVVVQSGLNQGTEAVRAYANGGSRFMFTGTLDTRLQKGFPLGRFRGEAVFDAYNLLNMSNEVEEDIVTGPGFRTITAVQPTRAFHIGFRLTF